MNARAPRAHGYLLIELLVVAGLGAGVIWILGELLLDGLYLQRLAGQHEARVVTMGTLTRQLRADALSATGYDWQADTQGFTLSMTCGGDDRAHAVRYVLGPARATRHEDGVESHAWQAERLRFTARLEFGSTADVLLVSFTELPPPRSPNLPPRRISVSMLLPPIAGGHGSGSEDRP